MEDHIPVFRQLQSVSSVKPVTRKDLLRRLTKGKEYIDTHFILPLQVDDIARECGLSEYHFYRLFKNVFGISPHQKIVQNRLTYGRHLIKHKYASVSDAALASGFSDVYAFSKSFKKHFGFSPSLNESK